MLPIQIFHQHVPLLGESPPHEIHCSQWGDQHTEGKPQLDEGQGGGEWNIRFCNGEEGYSDLCQVMSSSLLGDLSALYPVVEKDLSDSGSIDCSIEFLMQAGGRLVCALV